MDVLRISDLIGLMKSNQGPCVTIMLPTNVSGPDQEQDSLRLRNLADQAQESLAKDWLRASQARDWLLPVRQCSQDHDFWCKRSLGLALFLRSGLLQRFRLPIPLEELALVNHRFYIKPLIRLAAGNHRFLVLTVSQHHVALYQATQFHIERLNLPGLAQHIGPTLNIQGADRGQQRHLAHRWGRGKQTSVFHGQGGVKDTHKSELALFFQQIDQHLGPTLRYQHAPLVLAGVDYLLPILRKAISYPNVIDASLIGNWDHASESQLHGKAWPLVQPYLLSKQSRAIEKFHDLSGTELTSWDLQTSMKAACDGRIDTLFVDTTKHHWGRCDSYGQVHLTHMDPQPGDDDLLDHAAAETLLHGGQVYTLESAMMPTQEPIAAILRY